jgi:hypothetical protein
MKKRFFLTFLCFSFALSTAFGQRKLSGNEKRENTFVNENGEIDTLQTGSTKVILSGKTKYTDYKIFSFNRCLIRLFAI